MKKAAKETPPILRVRRRRSELFKVDDREQRFVPAGMTGTLLDVDGEGNLTVSWDLAFAAWNDGDEPRVVRGCEESGVIFYLVEWAESPPILTQNSPA